MKKILFAVIGILLASGYAEAATAGV